MPKYENTSKAPLKLLTASGIQTIAPAQIVELTSGIASRGAPYLKEVKEVAQTPQLLIEAPLAVAEVGTLVETEEEETIKIDVDGDGVPDLEISGSIIEEEEEEEEVSETESVDKPKSRNNKRNKRNR